MLKIIAISRRSVFLGVLILFGLIAGFDILNDNRASAAAPICFQPNTAVAAPTGAMPRTGLARNRDVAGCAQVPQTTGYGADFSETNGAHIVLSSYYSTSTGAPGSTLHTPNASISVYSRGLTRPTVAQSVRISVWYCRGSSVTAVAVLKGSSFIGTHSQTATFTPAEFIFDAPTNRFKTTNDVIAQIINPNSTSMICKISADSLTGDIVLGLTPDSEEDSPATNGVPNRYNQTFWNTSTNPNKRVVSPLYPAGTQTPYGAIAFRSDARRGDGSSARLEYALSFQPDCTFASANPAGKTVYLKVYDADGPSSGNPPGTTNSANDGIDYFPKMLVYEYNAAGAHIATHNPTGDPENRVRIGNDEFNQYGFYVTPGRKYTWVFWNVSANNGLQVWLPFAEATGLPDFSCPPPYTVAASCSIVAATIEPGNYTPQIVINYTTTGSGPPSATFNSTINVGGNVRNATGTVLAPNSSSTVSFAPVVSLPNAGTYAETASISGTAGGVPLNATCTGATSVLVIARPYFKVFNGGANVGAGFNSGTTTCSSVSTGQVSGYATNTPSFRGASTQFDLRALRSVATTFYSSGGNPTGSPNYKALTFANNAPSGLYGGNYGGTSCITDYYATTKVTGIGTYPGNGNINIASSDAQAGANNQIESLINRTFTGGNLGPGGQLVIYVIGNVYITGNITLNQNYNSLADIPFFALVVKGNIMIAPGVTILDGLYIAQPNGATGGTIYTCAASASTIPAASSLYNTCRTKLTFNGAVVAKSIKLLRTVGTLNQGPANELATSANVAEVFNGMPELFFANPAFKVDATSTGLYDSITSLPPLL